MTVKGWTWFSLVLSYLLIFLSYLLILLNWILIGLAFLSSPSTTNKTIFILVKKSIKIIQFRVLVINVPSFERFHPQLVWGFLFKLGHAEKLFEFCVRKQLCRIKNETNSFVWMKTGLNTCHTFCAKKRIGKILVFVLSIGA